ncbi:hypothetical protein CC85DRAFT_285582 [Cutaneotrichosporon oleaginosum]|uniref:F-box domain-containing protein n=1 Tax=Cutaneotrichosporon oleaginosum TaxID=879819 RepID=A0A0J0XMK8_9TREE|nr:uncharacterized protein CC85DRAFT_285582 [Cutaneotrichosporon oleaginosum]KLT42341.1 hypothetical protein CC85DRAFT_285582 [Cutaneotrichosporon oleaginosum]TXT04161.1 hypothetical protein COLE_07858 [Cutaneotrichosporon oleaginosum]
MSNHDPCPDEPPRLDALPPEILEVVFSFLPRKDLATVLGVNTRLLTTAYPLLYRHLVLHARFPSLRGGIRGLSPLDHIHSLHLGQHDPSTCAAALSTLDTTPGTSHVLPLLSLPATAHPNVRDTCPLASQRMHTLVIRAAPLLYVRVTYTFHAVRVPRAIVVFTPDSAVVGTNFKYEVAPDGPNGFLRRFPNARVVVWVFAARCWRPSPRPRNTEPRAHSRDEAEEDGQVEGEGGAEEGEKKREAKRRMEERREHAYLARTWVGRLLSPAVFGALKRRCPAVRELVLVNVEALDPIAVVEADLGPEHVGRVVRRWVAHTLRGMEGWSYEERGDHNSYGVVVEEGVEQGQKGQQRLDADDVKMRCVTLEEFTYEERMRGTAEGGVRREEIESWFEEE